MQDCRRSLTLLVVAERRLTYDVSERRQLGGNFMLIRTPRELGAIIRDHRRQQGLDQQELASKIGVSRQWVVEVEKGKPRAEVGLVLRALDALGVIISLARPQPTKTAETEPEIDIDQIVDNAKRKGR